MKTLQVLRSAYRATLEEQDDTIVWLTHAMAKAGGPFGVLLTGNAVSYAVQSQRAPALSFGEWQQTCPPDVSADLASLSKKGVALYAVAEHLEERGIRNARLIDSITLVPARAVARLYEEYDRVWCW